MTFQTLFGGELFCMPDNFGERHALRAWGTCNSTTEQYSIGQPKVPQVRFRAVVAVVQRPHEVGDRAVIVCKNRFP